MNELIVATSANQALVATNRANYTVTSPLTQQSTDLKRDVDFGVIPKTKKPSLYKSGAEKIIMAYGLMCRYTVVSSIEEKDFFFYNIRCDLYKGYINPNTKEYQEVLYANGLGSSNTGESRNGYNSAANSANATLKMAQKRAMVQAALAVSGLSSMFSQDIEDETAVSANDMIEQKPTDKINSAQNKRLFAKAGQAGMTTEQFKQWMLAKGYPKSRDITVEQFEKIIEELKKENE